MPRSRLRLVLRVALTIAVVGVVAAGALVAADRTDRCDGQADVREEDGQCVGVTAALSDFDRSELADVVGRIARANAEAESDDQHVSVAVFLPMTPAADGLVPIEWVRHQLQGAYQAQADHNRNSRPRVRLLLANPGGRVEHWERVVEELDRRRDGPDHLVAVTGIGLSLDNARAAMRRLSELRIPMVGSTITADDLDRIPGLLRPAPTNRRQAAAAASYVKATGASTALLVVDTDTDDLYPRTLADAFRAQFDDDAHRVLSHEQQYDSSLDGVNSAFALMLPNICATDADVVYFAGRGQDLALFIGQLGSRVCQDRAVSIVTADDVAATLFHTEEVRAGLASGVTVIYTDLAHPGAWAADAARPSAERAFADSAISRFVGVGESTVCFRCVFPEESLDDGAAIMAHDAVLTVTTALQKTSGSSARRVKPTELLQTFNALNGENAVVGSSGMLSYDNSGTVERKVVPVLRLREDGTTEFLHLESR
ncbi:ABC transporter substrate-binding protein [Umezawaea beigongshangensis]|uniref:ABC transporter substrate-binding protein n=1 Tax=Umezawaea beigongshangensis TaxID=2780383 RepID=UPI0018F2292A|nr:ABC transporter substrate-binding protein [Umezawaea beigongshangensis]